MKMKGWWDDAKLLRKGFVVAREHGGWDEEQKNKKNGMSYEPNRSDLRPAWEDRVHIPDVSGEDVVRYIRVGSTFYCELWRTYQPKKPGRYGRQRSQLISRYTLRMNKGKNYNGDNDFSFHNIGDSQGFFWGGGLGKFRKRNGDSSSLQIELDEKNRVVSYTDSTRGEFNPRIIEFDYPADSSGKVTRVVSRKRTKLFDRRLGSGRTSGWIRGSRRNTGIEDGEARTVRSAGGQPLLDDGDFTEEGFAKTGERLRVSKYVSGRKHGRELLYNKQGRLIEEKFYHHGTKIPRWVFTNPEDISLEEILGEENVEVRRAMLELQGFDIFMARAEAKGLVEVVQRDEDERVGTLLRITLPGMDKAWRPERQEIQDSFVYTMLKVKDGTLDKHYILRVPNHIKTAREGNAWTWGLKEQEYFPAIER